jgi:hypothetical protein
MPTDAESCFRGLDEIDGKSDGKIGGGGKNNFGCERFSSAIDDRVGVGTRG